MFVLLSSMDSLSSIKSRLNQVGFDIKHRPGEPMFEAVLGRAKITAKVASKTPERIGRDTLGYRPSFVYIEEMCEIPHDVWQYLKARVATKTKEGIMKF